MGFVAVGVAQALPPPYLEEFYSWLKRGFHGEMSWMATQAQARSDPSRVLKGCKAVVCLAYPYTPSKPRTPDGLSAARFTEGLARDYHFRLKELAAPLVELIKQAFPESKSRVCVDSTPLLERGYAQKAGLGFIGKNNMLIVPGYGSFCYLAEILTTAPLAPTGSGPPEDECGECSLCLEACPTGALVSPFLLDARICLSFITVESKLNTPVSLGKKMGGCFFGCDACQEACPHNNMGGDTSRPSLPSAKEMLEMDQEHFSRVFRHTSFWRTGLEKLKSNIMAATGHI